MENFLTRTTALIGENAVKKLKNSCVLIFGLGGVGGYVVEGLVRAGVGKLILVDADSVSGSNLNRQIIATKQTVGRLKTEEFVNRINLINPKCEVKTYNLFVTPENINLIDFDCDFVVDAIDTITTKIEIAKKAQTLNLPIISCMGTGNKLNANAFEFADIYKTSVCPLAKVMRKLCKENEIKKLKVLYSKEEPQNTAQNSSNKGKKNPPASISYVPAVAGLLIAGEAIKTLIQS